MALIVEDGSIILNANSYVSRVDYIAYAASKGVTIADTEAADYELIKAAEFIDSHEPKLKGNRYSRDQSMAYPRTELYIEGWYWSYNEIPRNVILAQMSLAMDINSGSDLYNPETEKITTVEKVEGAVEVHYAAPSKVVKTSIKTVSNALLNSLMRNSGLIQLVRS